MGKKKEKLIMEKQFDDSIKQIKKLKKKVISQMEKEHAEFKESDPTIDFKKEIKDRDKTIESLNKAIEDSDNNIEKLQKEILKLKEENNELVKKVGKLEEKLEKRKEIINKMYGENDSTESNRDLIAKYSKLEEKCTKHKNELDETRRELTEERDKSNSLEAQLNNAKISIEKLQKRVKELNENSTSTRALDFIYDCLAVIDHILHEETMLGPFESTVEQMEKINVYKSSSYLYSNALESLINNSDDINDIKNIISTIFNTFDFKDSEKRAYLVYNLSETEDGTEDVRTYLKNKGDILKGLISQ